MTEIFKQLEEALTAAVALAGKDDEFQMYAATWSGSLTFVAEPIAWRCDLKEAVLTGPNPAPVDRTDVLLTEFFVRGTVAAWESLLLPIPPPPFTDFFVAARNGLMQVEPIIDSASQHSAIRRFCWLLRHAFNRSDAIPTLPSGSWGHGDREASTGSYVHVQAENVDYRIFYEEAGEGIPLLCHHTAGADARQWRHILNDPKVISRYRVIAYDLPFHGRSLPPESRAWWAEEYQLTRARATAFVLGMAEVLSLERPVFLGCSIGGMLALDLARYHAERFRLVIALEAGLRSPNHTTPLQIDRTKRLLSSERLADPALHAARIMSAMSPTAPESSRRETALHYAQSAPGVLPGDVYFFAMDHNLEDDVFGIDTTRCGVHLLTGEYDYDTVPLTKNAAENIPGATFQIMKGLGHFPMSEDYDQLMYYLLPLLDEIAAS